VQVLGDSEQKYSFILSKFFSDFGTIFLANLEQVFWHFGASSSVISGVIRQFLGASS